MNSKFFLDTDELVQPRLALVGGFLGAGKTTLIIKAVRMLADKRVSSFVVTNDQASGLVDTAILQASGAKSVFEVAGGCFCCRLEDLVKVLKNQISINDIRQSESPSVYPPSVIVAEPVGSCVDLVSTVLLPLEKVYQVPLAICPLSVVVDARRALASLGGQRTPGNFSKDVGYIYRKQLEEADIVVVNKADLMSPTDLSDLLRRLGTEYPSKEVYVLSAKTGEGVEAWLERILSSRTSPARLMEMDYARYGSGEALLGWMNAQAEISTESDVPREGDMFLLELAHLVSAALAEAGTEVAHFKMSFTDETGRLGTVNQVMSGESPESSKLFGGLFHRGLLTINLRAEGDPEQFRAMVEAKLAASVESVNASCRIVEFAAFRPGQPVPTARVTSL